MQIVPLQPVQSQTSYVTLNGQVCTINVYQKGILPSVKPLVANLPNILQLENGYPFESTSRTWLYPAVVYFDLYVSNVLIVAGVACLNGVALVRSSYLGFVGDLAFYDTQGSSDPVYQGLGTRYQLVYLLPGDVISSVETLTA